MPGSPGDWQDFLRGHNLLSSMSRRGNCHDNAVAESFFQLLKRKRIRRQIYATRDAAKADVFNYNGSKNQSGATALPEILRR